jgi:RNA polymerase sigma factor (TIGR02999 family)
MSDVTQVLSRIEAGEPHAAEALLPLVYGELRKLAAARLAHECSGQTLQATSLVHEAYLRLVGGNSPQHWNGRGHFFMAAAEAMRRILVERARRRRRIKHGGHWHRQDLDMALVGESSPSVDLLALNDALDKLAGQHPAKAELVKLRYFAGFTVSEAAQALGISVATAERHWAFARGWLFAEMTEGGGPPVPASN